MTEVVSKYSREEVSKYDGRNGSRVWIIIKDNVIDVTDQLDQHPGGREVIMEFAGKDATKAFNNVGHSSEAQGYMKSAKIGELVEEPDQYFTFLDNNDLSENQKLQCSIQSDKSSNRSKTNASAAGVQGKETKSGRSFLAIISCGIFS